MVLQIVSPSERLKSISRKVEKVSKSLEELRLKTVISRVNILSEEIKVFGGPGSGPRPGQGRGKKKGGGGGFKKVETKEKMVAFEELHRPKSSLTDEEFDAVDQYRFEAFELNAALREGKVSEKMQVQVDGINNTFDKTPRLQENVVLYRGLGVDQVSTKDNLLPSRIQDKGFVSTSLDINVAKEYALERSTPGIIMEINVPKGTRVLSMSGSLKSRGGFYFDEPQREFLLPPNSSFRIKSLSRRREGSTFITFAQVDLVK